MALVLATVVLIVLDFAIRTASLAITGWRLRDRNVLFIDQAGWAGKRIVTVRLYVREYRVRDGRLVIGPLHIVRAGRPQSPIALAESVTWPEGSIFFAKYRELELLLAPETALPWADVPDVPVIRLDFGAVKRFPQVQTLKVLDLTPVNGVDIPPVAESGPGIYPLINVPSPHATVEAIPGFYAAGSRAFVNYQRGPGFYAVTLLPVLYIPIEREARVARRITMIIRLERLMRK